MQSAATIPRSQKHGLWLGMLGVTLFALTLPMTRLATGTADNPQLSGVFIALGRAAVAALLSIPFLLAVRAPLPRREDWRGLFIVALGVVFGFPLCTSIAMRYVEAVHASVMLGVLPLATAVAGARLQGVRPSVTFWLCALGGTALVVVFAVLHSGHDTFALHPADALLLAGMVCAAVGYAWGARLAQRMPAEQVICWALLLSLPLTLPLSGWTWPAQPVHWSAWGGFAYVAVISMWLGFFAWYRGLALGGTVRVSQLQLLQPFLSMLFAVPLLGESLDTWSLGFALAVVALVFTGRRMPVHTPR